MKPRNDVIQIRGSLGGEITKMELDQNALVHLMSVLTNLYSDTELAVIREYSTNALDSHIFAGQGDPIEVSTPNAFTNEFVVKDYGLGLSKDEIQNVYGHYGASTKRDSDDVAGCLGLGSKSALAYGSAFTVVGVKDGMMTTAVISLGQDGAGQIEVVDEVETDERNGVTVRVPVDNRYDFRDAVTKFFSYWDKGTVLVDGEAPLHFSDVLTQIDDSVWFGSGGYYGSITVVMGGVSYEVSDSSYTRNIYGHRIVVKADMGDVDFVPSREALNMTPRVRDYLKELVNYVVKRADHTIQKQIDASHSCKDVIALAMQRMAHHGNKVTWNGNKYELNPSIDTYIYNVSERKLRKAGHFQTVNAYEEGTAILVGKPFTVLSSLQRDKIAKYLTDNDMKDIETIVYFDGPVPFLAREAVTLDFAEINVVKVAKRTPGGKRLTGLDANWEHYFWNASTNRLEGADGVLDPQKTIFYVSGAKTPTWRGREVLKHLADPNIVFVKMAANRENSFRKAFPKAQSQWEFYNALIAKFEAKVTEDDWAVYNVNGLLLRALSDETADPKIAEIWNAYESSRGRINKYKEILQAVGQGHRIHDKVPNSNYIEDNYPLATGHNPEASIEYINAVYLSRKGKGLV